MDRVEATEPLLRMAGDPEPPDLPPFDEWGLMDARLRTIGSSVVADGYDEFASAAREFFVQGT
jgi:hypothetical protein